MARYQDHHFDRLVDQLAVEAEGADVAATAIVRAYDAAWEDLRDGTLVAKHLGLRGGEHLEIAAWGWPGAKRVAERIRERIGGR